MGGPRKPLAAGATALLLLAAGMAASTPAEAHRVYCRPAWANATPYAAYAYAPVYAMRTVPWTFPPYGSRYLASYGLGRRCNDCW